MRLNRTLAAVGLAALAGMAIAQQTPPAPAADAEQLLADALAQATKEGKSVFLTTHASW